MNETQIRALELWLQAATLSNNFEPLSENALTKRLKAEGYVASSSSVHRWKKKFGWEEILSANKLTALGSESSLNEIVKDTPLEVIVKNTNVDIARNGVLIAASYQALEIIMGGYLRRLEEGLELNKDEKNDVIKIAALSTDRYDRMLDRLANMPLETKSSAELIAELTKTRIEMESGVYDAEIIKGASDE